jgi:hypothetical protein
LPTFREAYRKRRCILPVDGFSEWRASKAGKQPYAIAMKDGSPFGIAGIWENWKDSATGEWVRTFAVITVPANDLVTQIHDRMPAILKPEGYVRWLSRSRIRTISWSRFHQSRCGCGPSRGASTNLRMTNRAYLRRCRRKRPSQTPQLLLREPRAGLAAAVLRA